VVRVPPLEPDEVIAILISLGFTEVRQRGSHKLFRDGKGRGPCRSHQFARQEAATARRGTWELVVRMLAARRSAESDALRKFEPVALVESQPGRTYASLR
jgi:hypothetical protein